MAAGVQISIDGDPDSIVEGSPDKQNSMHRDCLSEIIVLPHAKKVSWNKEFLVFVIGSVKTYVAINSLPWLIQHGWR
jgi:hypothetical protein